MYQYKGGSSDNKAMPYYDCIFPAYLHERQLVQGADDIIGDFTHPDYKQIDESYLHSFLRRSLEILKLEKLKRERNPPEPDGADPAPDDGKPISFTYNLNHFKTGEFSTRLIVLDFEKLLSHPQHFVVGFFSNKKSGLDNNSPVVKKVWDLDDRLVAALGQFPCIHAYITCMKENGEYFNFVFLDNDTAISKWRAFKVHDAAVVVSPSYYEWVRLNHAVLPCSLESILYKEGGEKRLEIIRSKYFLYHKGDCVWRGIRKHKADYAFSSLVEHQPNRPFVFASFLGDNAFRFYKKLVEYIGNTTGLPVKMIDVAALTRDEAIRPNDLASILKYNIDFAFTCGLSYVKFFPNLVALAAPVRNEKRYDGNAVYFADIIVNSSSPYNTIEDLKEKVFCINEEISYSGCTAPEYHFKDQGGLKGYFSQVVRSGSHAVSMDYVRDGKADAAAIDSVVYEMELSQRPERSKEFRVLDSTRATSMPPFAASTWVPLQVQKLVQKALLNVHKKHKHLLNNNGFTQFVEVNDDKYVDIREVITFVEEMRDKQKKAGL